MGFAGIDEKHNVGSYMGFHGNLIERNGIESMGLDISWKNNGRLRSCLSVYVGKRDSFLFRCFSVEPIQCNTKTQTWKSVASLAIGWV